MESVFIHVVQILAVAAAVGVIGTLLRQPLIISFIAVGLIVGPWVLGIVHPESAPGLLGVVQLLGDMGIALLLFGVGLTLNLSNMRTMGSVALAAGIGQMVFTILFGSLLAVALGMSGMAPIYVGIALAMSSAVIPMKILADRGEVESLHGRVAIGALIIQDVGVIAGIVILSALGAVDNSDGSMRAQLAAVLLNGVLLVAATALLARFVLPRLVDFLNRSAELVVLFAVTWAIGFAVVAETVGLSREFGAFLAGIAFASTRYREAFAAPLSRLRDFLLVFFFVGLGATLDPAILRAQVSQAAVFALFVLLGNTAIVMVIMGLMGYRSRTSFFTGTALAQTSVFSLVVAAMGVSLGHITVDTLGLITLVAFVTIGVCTYVLTYSSPIYERLRRVLSIFERKRPFRELSLEEKVPEAEAAEVVVLGLGRFGGGIIRGLQLRQRKILGVDFDPEVLSRWTAKGLPVAYGDIADAEMLRSLPLDTAGVIVAAVPGLATNLEIRRVLERLGYTGRVALTAQTEAEAAALRAAGADIVLELFAYAAEHSAEAVSAALHAIPDHPDLPLALADVRLPAGSTLVGRQLREATVRAESGATIIAVSRAGRAIFDPDPDLQLFPGDHLIMMGSAEELLRAQDYLQHQEFEDQPDYEFAIESIDLDAESELTGHTLAELDFRNRYGATVIGIERGEGEFMRPSPHEPLQIGDRLYVACHRGALENMPS